MMTKKEFYRRVNENTHTLVGNDNWISKNLKNKSISPNLGNYLRYFNLLNFKGESVKIFVEYGDFETASLGLNELSICVDYIINHKIFGAAEDEESSPYQENLIELASKVAMEYLTFYHSARKKQEGASTTN